MIAQRSGERLLVLPRSASEATRKYRRVYSTIVAPWRATVLLPPFRLETVSVATFLSSVSGPARVNLIVTVQVDPASKCDKQSEDAWK